MFRLEPATVLWGYLAIAAFTGLASAPLNKDCRNPDYDGRMLGACLLSEGMAAGVAWPAYWAWEAYDFARLRLFTTR